MSTNRELYFQYKKEGIPDTVIYFALEEINGFNHLELTNNFDKEIKDENRFVSAMKRYQNGEMIEYIFNKAYFLSKPFYVDQNVLIPRQETEQLVLNTAKLILAVSSRNIKEHKLTNVSTRQGDMLAPFIEDGYQFDAIICNPPYIENESTIDEKTWKQEPHLALLAKPGTLFYERVFQDYLKIVKDEFIMAFEIGEDQEEALTKLVNKYCSGCSFYFEKDMYNKTRFLYIKGKK